MQKARLHTDSAFFAQEVLSESKAVTVQCWLNRIKQSVQSDVARLKRRVDFVSTDVVHLGESVDEVSVR